MLGRNKKQDDRSAKPTVEPFTYIHHGTTFTGTLEASGRVRVHGTIHGSVKVDGVLEVADAGVIEGALIEAVEVKILGRVCADVHASGKIEIWKNGVLIGDVRAVALDIEEGASFTGRSEMTLEDGQSVARLPAGGAADAARAGGLSAAELEENTAETPLPGRDGRVPSRD